MMPVGKDDLGLGQGLFQRQILVGGHVVLVARIKLDQANPTLVRPGLC